MVRLDELAAEPISHDALNSAVKAGTAPSRDVFERTAVAARQSWNRIHELSAALSLSESQRKVLQGKIDGLGKVLAGGGNYTGDATVDVASLRAYAMRMREVRARIMDWIDTTASRKGPEGAALANTIASFLGGIEPPAVIGK